MQIHNMRGVEDGTVIEADLAVIGTGPAALSLAGEFSGSGVRVVLLESGGLTESGEIAASEVFESTGAPRSMDPRQVRNRVFGGSSHTWSGKCRTFDPIDFEHREWVPHSGWPIMEKEVAPYAERAATLMNLGPNTYGKDLWALLGRRRPEPDVCCESLETCFWQFSRDPEYPMEFLNFGHRFMKAPAPNVQAFVNAPVTAIDTDASGRRLAALQISPVRDRRVRIVPKVAVVACGGIENARLLLASNRVCPSGLGNENDTVGRFLMDHPRTSLGEYPGTLAKEIQERFGLFALVHEGKPHFYARGLALSAAAQRRKQLLNCACYLSEHRAVDDPWDALKRLRRNESQSYFRDVLSVAASPRLLLEGLWQRTVCGRNVRHKVDRLVFDCLVEQVPDPESRITLSERRDELGTPIPRLHWKISELERWTVFELAGLLACEVAELGLEPPVPPDWFRDQDLDAIPFSDVAHPTGTTRMSDDPKQGVVDRTCRLHGVDGLYVAGSSVFPTASHANPTLMIVAMSLRLADWIKQRHFS